MDLREGLAENEAISYSGRGLGLVEMIKRSTTKGSGDMMDFKPRFR